VPSTSAKQEKFMRAVANSPKFAKKVGVPQSVGKEFEMKDMKKMSSGGRLASKGEHSVQKKSKRGAKMVTMAGNKMAKGGMAKMAYGGMAKMAKGGKAC
jgi:hypothetical protein